ncbi:MAG: hydroxyacylglutathione hydrolase [Betaproteobacteria bacterium]|nr:hydroxyacylglutathione hydrolase [Betaproteobacteria bacterium]
MQKASSTYCVDSGSLAEDIANIRIEPIPALSDNYIWLIHRAGNAAVVDPGDAAPVLSALNAAGLSLTAILITHHHADHQAGVTTLVEHWQAEVFGPAAESIACLTHPLKGDEEIEIPGLALPFFALSVPGHTRGHLAYYGAGSLFCGDTLFAGGCGRIFEGTPRQMSASLAALAGLPDGTHLCCAHEYTAANLRFALAVEPGNSSLQRRALEVAAMRENGEPTLPSLLAEEKATNPFLRCREPELIASVQNFLARESLPPAQNEMEIFAALRAWKDRF